MTVADVQVGEQNGAAPGTPTNNVSHINMGSVDQVNLDPSLNVILATENAFEKWNFIYLLAINDSNKIDNFKVWLTPSTPETGISYLTNLQNPLVNDAYTTPTASTSTVADQAYPTAEPGSENIGVSGGSGGLDTDTTRSDLFCSQLQTTGSAAPGDVSQKTVHVQYDEQ